MIYALSWIHSLPLSMFYLMHILYEFQVNTHWPLISWFAVMYFNVKSGKNKWCIFLCYCLWAMTKKNVYADEMPKEENEQQQQKYYITCW